ncbi:hypothetical protein RDI58_000511 [Solanum bulbocastanum]|uniref:Protein TIFY n=1 Tax=Solanum bulbocastanum TaxID=147425 RepID=A0AAN8U7H7_SOLBU
MSIDNVIGKTNPNEVLKNATTKIVTLSFICDETVEILNVSRDKAEEILKFAYSSNVVNVSSSKKPVGVETQSRDISMTRRNSQLRFLEKRKERLCGGLENGMKIVLLTIGCNGKVANFNVSREKAKEILMFAEKSKIKKVIPPKKQLFVETLSGDLPLARRNSLLRFSEKQNARLDSGLENGIIIAPLTICYDGTSVSFNIFSDKVANILEFAERSKTRDAVSSEKQLFVETLSGAQHLARRNSMLGFSEKRKDRGVCGGSENGMKVALLTICYNGMVAFFHVSSDKANDILKFAERSKIKNDFSSNYGDLPLARSISLPRFSEKLKTRLDCGSENGIKILPMTFYYDGKTASLNVSIDKAANILAFAESSKFSDACPSGKKISVETLSGDQHLVRRNSMLGFSEKQKERLCGGSENGLRIALLTICYNGMVANFNVSNDKANEILKFAKMSITNDVFSLNNGDLPLPKINSSLRFFEKPQIRLDCDSENDIKVAPLTIFYGGKSAVYDVSSEKAANILKFVERDAFSSKKQFSVGSLSGDLHLATRNLMLGVLENQKERFCPSRFGMKIAPLTIFYNEKVTIFEVFSEKVDGVLKFAESSKQPLFVKTLSEDVPSETRKSSVKFLEKQKERLDCDSENGFKVAPLTIFYDGKIAVFDVSSEKAENILKFVERDAISSKKQFSLEPLSGDLHLATRNFILGVLVNRKERFCPSRFGAIKIAPLSIFYNKKVAIFDVRSDKVDGILKFAESSKQQLVVKTLSEDVPLATRKSSVRFLEKRQERMTMVSPYGFPHAGPGNKN